MWQLLRNAHRGKKIIADVSQSIDRCRISANGVCPTVTPQSILCIQAASRQVSPMDTLAMHFFPVHRMNIPNTIKAKLLRSLGGNTMHLKSVGLAMCMGLAMLKPSFGVVRSEAEDVGRSEGIRNVVFLDSVGERSASAKRRAAGRRLPLKRRRVGPARH